MVYNESIRMILVILHAAEHTRYDTYGNLIEEKGAISVSHGININTGRNVILPCDSWSSFQRNCVLIEGEWYLK